MGGEDDGNVATAGPGHVAFPVAKPIADLSPNSFQNRFVTLNFLQLAGTTINFG